MSNEGLFALSGSVDTRPHACGGEACQVCALDRARGIPTAEKLARRTDPATSKEAAASLHRNTLLRSLLIEFGRADLTAEEAGTRAGLDESSGYWKRVSDLLNAGYIEPVIVDGEMLTRIASSGRQQRVLRITSKGSDQLFTDGGF